MKLEERVADILLEHGCVAFSPERPYTYASGLKGPLYCDNRLIISDVEAREQITQAFLELLNSIHEDFDAVAGIATAGIPHAAWVAQTLKKPMIYIRPKKKEHGKKSAIEGQLPAGSKILLIEDLVNQGKSSCLAYDLAKEEKLTPIGCLAIVHYQMVTANQEFAARQCPLWFLTDFFTLVRQAERKGNLTKADINTLYQWQEDPAHWSP